MICKYCNETMDWEHEDYCCDNCGATYNIQDMEWTDPVVPKTEMNKELWRDSSIQFPRLIAELNAIALTSEQIKEICDSMDISSDELCEIFERANTLWEVAKARSLNDEAVYVNCPSCQHVPLPIEGIDDDNTLQFICPHCNADVLIDEDGYIMLQE